MNTDNYVLVRKEDTDWVGYMQCASKFDDEVTHQVEPLPQDKLFCTDTLASAILLAQDRDAEYGYRFEVRELYDKSYFPKLCKSCGNVDYGNTS